MAPKRWATEDQLTFLDSYFPKYVHHQSNNSLTKFWPIFEQKWFKEFPVTSEMEPGFIAKQKKRIKEWFQNKSQATKRGKNASSLALDLGAPKTSRPPRVLEEYSRVCYDKKIKQNVESRLEMEDRPRRTLKIVLDEIKASWEQESEEFRREIIEKTARKSLEMKAKQDEQDHEEKPANRSPQEYATNIQGIPVLMTKLGAALKEQTGWVWTILGGGPDPAYADGQVRTVAYVLITPPEECASRSLGAKTATTSNIVKNGSHTDAQGGEISDFEDLDDDPIDYSFLHPDLRPGTNKTTSTPTQSPNPGESSQATASANPPVATTPLPPPPVATTPPPPPPSPPVATTPPPPPPPPPVATTPLPLSSPSTPASQPRVESSANTTRDGYVFPADLFGPEPRRNTPPPQHPPLGEEPAEWMTIVQGLKKRPAGPQPASDPQPAKKTKKAVAANGKKVRRNTTPQPEILQEKRVRRPRRDVGEVVPLTVDAQGKPLKDTPKKQKRSNKENRK
ncbi:hypothetical protein H0H93_008159 [Arthromyces matolae]|nr:hypothetical protein H0H93_008159 [Arthromyces matolae]